MDSVQCIWLITHITPAFIPPSWVHVRKLVNWDIDYNYTTYIYILFVGRVQHTVCLSQESICGLRLAVHLILSGKEDHFVTVWACVCGSWVSINQFTSGRSVLLPEGNVNRRYVEVANSMVSRCLFFACGCICFLSWWNTTTPCTHWRIKKMFPMLLIYIVSDSCWTQSFLPGVSYCWPLSQHWVEVGFWNSQKAVLWVSTSGSNGSVK